jgi:hypothetical protein
MNEQKKEKEFVSLNKAYLTFRENYFYSDRIKLKKKTTKNYIMNLYNYYLI